MTCKILCYISSFTVTFLMALAAVVIILENPPAGNCKALLWFELLVSLAIVIVFGGLMVGHALTMMVENK